MSAQDGDTILKAARSRIDAMKIAPCAGLASSRAAAEEMERALDYLSALTVPDDVRSTLAGEIEKDGLWALINRRDTIHLIVAALRSAPVSTPATRDHAEIAQRMMDTYKATGDQWFKRAADALRAPAVGVTREAIKSLTFYRLDDEVYLKLKDVEALSPAPEDDA